MAQASAITNSIRQLGGSLGVALLATLLTSRVIYHSQLYGGELEQNSVAYHKTTAELRYYMQNTGRQFSGKGYPAVSGGSLLKPQ